MTAFAAAPAAIPSLSSLSERLEVARSQIEARFFDAGGRLASSLELVGGLIKSLEHIGAALNAETVAETRQALLSTADGLTALPDGQRDRIGRMTRLRDASQALAGHIDAMRQTLRYLRAFAMNVKITAGGIEAAGDEFNGFADQMCGQLDVGGRELDQLAAQLTALELHLAEALARENALSDTYRAVIPAVPDRLKFDAHEISAHHTRIAQVTASVAALARAIQIKVARALTAMQIGDITRQRIEHVQLGLAVTSRYLTNSSVDSADAPRFRRKLVRLLADQMVDTASAFELEAAKVTESLSGMAQDTAQILAFDALTDGSGSDDLRSLEASLGEARLLIDNVDQAMTGARRISDEAAQAVTTLTLRVGAIQGVKRDIQQMAINSSLRCGRLGEVGRPLNVIALELSSHAVQLETSADQTLGSLDRLKNVADDLSGQPNTAIGAAQLDAVGGRLRQAAEVIERDLGSVGKNGQATARSLTIATEQLALQDDLGEVLHSAAVALFEEAGPPDEQFSDLAEPIQAAMDEIARSYTMARERTLHAQHAPPSDAAAPAPTPVAANDEEFADILF